MNTTMMIYNSVADKSVKPDNVKLLINLNSKNKEVSEAVNKINADRNLVKTFILDKKSYKNDSYQQLNFDIQKRTYRKYHYVNTTDNTIISEKEYEMLSGLLRTGYERKYEDVFMYYEATLSITVELVSNDTTVNDLVGICNMCTEKDFRCTYNIDISKELRESTMQELYVKCINEGVDNVKKIVSKLNFVSEPKVVLVDIKDTSAMSAGMGTMYESTARLAKCASIDEFDYEPEQIIMPELLEELFNNNIEITKSLDLRFEF